MQADFRPVAAYVPVNESELRFRKVTKTEIERSVKSPARKQADHVIVVITSASFVSPNLNSTLFQKWAKLRRRWFVKTSVSTADCVFKTFHHLHFYYGLAEGNGHSSVMIARAENLMFISTYENAYTHVTATQTHISHATIYVEQYTRAHPLNGVTLKKKNKMCLSFISPSVWAQKRTKNCYETHTR